MRCGERVSAFVVRGLGRAWMGAVWGRMSGRKVQAETTDEGDVAAGLTVLLFGSRFVVGALCSSGGRRRSPIILSGTSFSAPAYASSPSSTSSRCYKKFLAPPHLT